MTTSSAVEADQREGTSPEGAGTDGHPPEHIAVQEGAHVLARGPVHQRPQRRLAGQPQVPHLELRRVEVRVPEDPAVALPDAPVERALMSWARPGTGMRRMEWSTVL